MVFSRLLGLALALVLTTVLTSGETFGGTILLGETVSLSPVTERVETTVEFYIERTGLDAALPLEVGNFQVRLELSGEGAGEVARIVRIGEATRHPQAYPLDVLMVETPTTALAATLNLSAPIRFLDGAGLASVVVELMPGAVGPFRLDILHGDGDTEITDGTDFTTLLAISSQAATITTVVPEPASLPSVLQLTIAAHVIRSRGRLFLRIQNA